MLGFGNLLTMETELLNYELPTELIAQQPCTQRGGSRLCILHKDSGTIEDNSFADILNYIKAGDCLVLNDTQVLPARFFGQRKTGARIEALFLEQNSKGRWLVMIKNARRIKVGEQIILNDTKDNPFCSALAVEKRPDGRWLLDVEGGNEPLTVLKKIGFAPLPPYIKRPNGGQMPAEDMRRYQTVFAKRPGAVAAPTAGLHFTDKLLNKIRQKGVCIAYITLQVGAGTFKPITAEKVEQHKIHSELIEVDNANARIINRTRQAGGKIFAVGTTCVRVLEAVGKAGQVVPFKGSTDLFILPGYEFKIVDAMITNFHLPRSTLLALVGAFAGMQNILTTYQHCVEQKYRFYSFGDAMLII